MNSPEVCYSEQQLQLTSQQPQLQHVYTVYAKPFRQTTYSTDCTVRTRIISTFDNFFISWKCAEIFSTWEDGTTHDGATSLFEFQISKFRAIKREGIPAHGLLLNSSKYPYLSVSHPEEQNGGGESAMWCLLYQQKLNAEGSRAELWYWERPSYAYNSITISLTSSTVNYLQLPTVKELGLLFG